MFGDPFASTIEEGINDCDGSIEPRTVDLRQVGHHDVLAISEEVVEARVVVQKSQRRGVSHGVGTSLVSRFTASS